MSINISEVIWTVVCFFVLFFVLKKLFFDPMIRFLDQRQSRLDAAAEENKRVQEQVTAAQQAAEELLARRTQEDNDLLLRRRAENEQARLEAHRQARQDAEQHLKDVRAQLEREEADVAAEENLNELALALADRFVAEAGKKEQL